MGHELRGPIIVILCVLLFLTTSALGQSTSTEVRITAQRHADGRTEFALQQRDPGDSWSERLLPRGRFFAATSGVGRWLSSTPLRLSGDNFTMAAASDDQGIEIRINARLLQDDRIEFALQTRDPGIGGGWSARLLPSSRFFPASASIGRWLSSSPLTLQLPSSDSIFSPPSQSTSSRSSDNIESRPSPSCMLSDHVDRVVSATFQVQTDDSTGTAFYIGDEEWLTNHHVVEGSNTVDLVHGPHRIAARVSGSLPDHDLAFLRAQPPTGLHALALAGVRPSLGSSVSVIGFPTGVTSTPSLTRGVISKHAPFREFSGFSQQGVMVQIDAEINPGNSGGPIINDCGEVVGVATLKLFTATDGRDLDGIGFGIAAETVIAQLSALRASTHEVDDEIVAIGGTDQRVSDVNWEIGSRSDNYYGYVRQWVSDPQENDTVAGVEIRCSKDLTLSVFLAWVGIPEPLDVVFERNDEGEWYDTSEFWVLHQLDSGQVHVSQVPQTDYTILHSSSSGWRGYAARAERGATWYAVSFELGGMFSTPAQPYIEICVD